MKLNGFYVILEVALFYFFFLNQNFLLLVGIFLYANVIFEIHLSSREAGSHNWVATVSKSRASH